MRLFLAILLTGIALAVGVVWLNTREPAALPPPAPANTAPPARNPGTVEAPGRSAPRPETAPDPTAGDDAEAVVFEIHSEGDLILAMRELGIEDLEQRMTDWALSRGYPEFDPAGNLLLDQPYAQYDDETLRGLAENEDMWAQQILAQRLAKDKPAEAIEWYRRAAVNGSVYAMTELSRLYLRVASKRINVGLEQDANALNEAYAMHDTFSPEVSAYAWLAAAERSGWDATRSGSLTALAGRKLDEDRLLQACEHAATLHEVMAAERAGRGLDPFDQTPPPLVYQSENLGGATQCYPEDGGMDTSDCREVVLNTGPSSMTVWVCD